MRFFVLKQTKSKNDDRPKRRARIWMLSLLALCAPIAAISLFLLSPRFKTMTDVPKVSLVYSNGYYNNDFHLLDFQTGEQISIPKQEVLPFRNRYRASSGKMLYVGFSGTEEGGEDGYVITSGPREVEKFFQPRLRNIDLNIGWSPDGQWITFSAYPPDIDLDQATDSDVELWMMHTETEDLIRLTNNHVVERSPSFSPDNKNIVYVSEAEDATKIARLSVETKEIQIIASVPFAKNTLWSPDGQWIALEAPYKVNSLTYEGSKQILMMRADGTQLQRAIAEPASLVGWETYPLLRESIKYHGDQ